MKKKQTSINIDEQLWREFGAVLRLQGIDYSEAIEMLVRSYLAHGAKFPGQPRLPMDGLSALHKHLGAALAELNRE